VQKTCNISETVQDMGQDYYDGLIGNRPRSFDSYKNQWPWMPWTADTHSCSKDAFYGAQKKM